MPLDFFYAVELAPAEGVSDEELRAQFRLEEAQIIPRVKPPKSIQMSSIAMMTHGSISAAWAG
jgi:hypothetical protein